MNNGTKPNNSQGRDTKGLFVAGNKCGRKAGVRNKATIDIRRLLDRWLKVWDKAKGDEMLLNLSKRDPDLFLQFFGRMVSRVAGKTIEADGLQHAVTIQFIRDDRPVAPPTEATERKLKVLKAPKALLPEPTPEPAVEVLTVEEAEGLRLDRDERERTYEEDNPRRSRRDAFLKL